jgi:hypothetical protein
MNVRMAVAVALGLLATSAAAQQHGRFIGRVVAEWNRDPRGNTMTLVEDFAYIDPRGVRWDAPRGSVIDGASIPRPVWSIVGEPFDGSYREASVIHDVACDTRRRRWQDVHGVFYHAMLANGVSLEKAQYMYWAVYRFGPKWAPPGEVMGGGPTPPPSEAELRRAAAIIESRAASGRPMTMEELQQLEPR